MRLFGLATSTALHREITSLNLKPFLLSSFKVAKRELADTVTRMDDKNWNLVHDAQDGIVGIFSHASSLKILTYVRKLSVCRLQGSWQERGLNYLLQAIFALQASLTSNSAGILAACVQSDYFSAQVEDLIEQGETFQECSSGIIEILDKLTAFCEVKGIVEKTLAERKAVQPYVSAPNGGMELEFK